VVTLERERTQHDDERFLWQEAAIWLREYLSQQPGKKAESQQLHAAAAEAGYSKTVLARARQEIQLAWIRSGSRESTQVWYHLEPPPKMRGKLKHPRPILPRPGPEQHLRSGLFILEYLEDRPGRWAWVQEIKIAARAAGLSYTTLAKARAALDISYGRGSRAKYKGGSRGWWEIPEGMDVEAVKADWKERLRTAGIGGTATYRSKYVATEYPGIQRSKTRWSVRYHRDGKQHRRNFPLDRLEEALAFRDRMTQEAVATYESDSLPDARMEIMVLERLRDMLDDHIGGTTTAPYHLVLGRALVSQALLGWKTVLDKNTGAA
jgi:hypothetical protein